jgi:predicted site-specific integrase-resolvase
MSIKAKKLLSAEEAAERLGVASSTMQLWLSKGHVREAFKVGHDWIVPVSFIEDFQRPKRTRPPK